MSVPSPERGFAIAGLVLTVAFGLLAVTGGPSPATASDDLASVPTVDVPTPPSTSGTATVDGATYRGLDAALDAADPGDRIRLDGRFDERVTVSTPNVTLAGSGPDRTVIAGGGEGDVVRIEAPNVTLSALWIRDGGYDTETNDAGVWIDAPGATVRDSRITEMTFGIWIDSVADARVVDNTIVGRERIERLTERGNGIQVYEATDALIADNRITAVRDGIYYSWAEGVLARNNTMWNLRYGVHYMYSDENRLVGNTALGNDAGYALMVSEHLEVEDNVAVDNRGQSGHGILVKSIDDTRITNNTLEGNENGMFVYNSLDNVITGNAVRGNDIGVHLSAGSVRERVARNSFVGNGQAVLAVIGERVAWNESVGNYWGGAGTIDLDGDGVSELRYQPSGLVERLRDTHASAAVFTRSPAFDAIRRAEATVPIVDSPGVVDYRPLTEPPGGEGDD